MIKIDFTNTYQPIDIAADLSYMTFYSEVQEGPSILLKVKIMPLGAPLLPSVFNLAFGPILENGLLNDSAKINHLDKSKVFSTILLFSMLFLQTNPDIKIGIDGSMTQEPICITECFKPTKSISKSILWQLVLIGM